VSDPAIFQQNVTVLDRRASRSSLDLRWPIATAAEPFDSFGEALAPPGRFGRSTARSQ
jgi:hypothetical protein